jgi:hypothetical protein
MKKIIITILFSLIVSAMTPAFAQEEWFEVAEASGIGYDIAISREVPATEVPCQEIVLNKLTPSLMKDRASTAVDPSTKLPTSQVTGAVTGSWIIDEY